MGNIDNIIRSEDILKQTRIRRYDVDWEYCYAIDEEAEDAIETSPEVPTRVTKTYEEVVLDSTPVHYWRLDETSGGSFLDIGSGDNDATYGADVTLVQPPAIIGDDNPGYSVKFGGSTYATSYGSVADHDIGTTGEDYSNATFEFWLKVNDPISPTEDDQIIWGKRATGSSSPDNKNEFYFQIKRFNDNNRFRVYFYGRAYADDPNNDNWNIPRHVAYGPQASYMRINQWYHIALVMRNGIRTLYINGQRAGASLSPSPIKKTAGVMRWGYLGSGFSNAWETEVAKNANNIGVPITYNLDEIAMYSTALTETTVNRHYQVGRNLYNETASAGGGGTGTGTVSPCEGVVTEPPTLLNEEDISGFVSSYTIEKDYQTLVDTCTMDVYADWGDDTIRTKLQSDTYVIIQERYKTIDESIDTGWVDTGHYLSDGPFDKTLDAEGRKVFRIGLKSPMKLTTLDIVNRFIEGDKIFVPRMEAIQTANTTEVVKYQIPNPLYDGLYYQNWAETPRVRLWVSQFNSTDDIVTFGSPAIRVRGSEGSVQVVGGEGSVVIDKDFFESKVKDGGLGNPSVVEIELYRYATDLDIATFSLISSETQISGATIINANIVVTDPEGNFNSIENYIGRTLFVKDGASAGKRYKIIDVVTRAGPEYAFAVQTMGGSIPDLTDNIWSVDDTIQVTDANLVEDVLMKIFVSAGLQAGYPTRPFYFEIEPPSTPVIVPPIRYTFDDNIKWVELVQEVMEFAPPNYKLLVGRDGVTRTLTAVQKSVESGTYDHQLLKVMDVTEDRGDYGTYNRVIAIGQATTSVNVGLHSDNGGYSATGAYKLTNVFNGTGTGTGVTKTQNQMDAIIKQIPDGNPKTPNLSNNLYGTLYSHKTSDTQRYTLEDSDLFWMDIGLDDNDRDYLIDYLQFTVLPPYEDGQVINQSLCIYYMTNEDYIQETGDIPPSTSGDTTVATNLLAMVDSDKWKLLVDEFECQEGQTNVDEGEFVNGKAQRLRFLKVRCAQPYFRLKGGSSSVNVSRIVMSDMKVWTSMKIVQYAQLGKTPPFDTDPMKELFARMRRRTYILDKNLYLDTADKAKDYALNELRERYIEFAPLAITCFSPMVNLYDTIRYVDPETGEPAQYLVLGLRSESNGATQMQVTDYITGDSG